MLGWKSETQLQVWLYSVRVAFLPSQKDLWLSTNFCALTRHRTNFISWPAEEKGWDFFVALDSLKCGWGCPCYRSWRPSINRQRSQWNALQCNVEFIHGHTHTHYHCFYLVLPRLTRSIWLELNPGETKQKQLLPSLCVPCYCGVVTFTDSTLLLSFLCCCPFLTLPRHTCRSS